MQLNRMYFNYKTYVYQLYIFTFCMISNFFPTVISKFQLKHLLYFESWVSVFKNSLESKHVLPINANENDTHI